MLDLERWIWSLFKFTFGIISIWPEVVSQKQSFDWITAERYRDWYQGLHFHFQFPVPISREGGRVTGKSTNPVSWQKTEDRMKSEELQQPGKPSVLNCQLWPYRFYNQRKYLHPTPSFDQRMIHGTEIHQVQFVNIKTMQDTNDTLLTHSMEIQTIRIALLSFCWSCVGLCFGHF